MWRQCKQQIVGTSSYGLNENVTQFTFQISKGLQYMEQFVVMYMVICEWTVT